MKYLMAYLVEFRKLKQNVSLFGFKRQVFSRNLKNAQSHKKKITVKHK